jgi:hypothetical protein
MRVLSEPWSLEPMMKALRTFFLLVTLALWDWAFDVIFVVVS